MPRINFIATSTTLSVRVASAFALAGSMLLWGGSEALAQKCKSVHGHFINQVLATASFLYVSCGVCVNGKAIGVLKGDFLAHRHFYHRVGRHSGDWNCFFDCGSRYPHEGWRFALEGGSRL